MHNKSCNLEHLALLNYSELPSFRRLLILLQLNFTASIHIELNYSQKERRMYGLFNEVTSRVMQQASDELVFSMSVQLDGR